MNKIVHYTITLTCFEFENLILIIVGSNNINSYRPPIHTDIALYDYKITTLNNS
jgi:hypothetical protein